MYQKGGMGLARPNFPISGPVGKYESAMYLPMKPRNSYMPQPAPNNENRNKNSNINVNGNSASFRRNMQSRVKGYNFL